MFAHGLGGSLAYYAPLMQQWASAGYVVAAPNFPLTNAETQGAVDPGDFRNQPGDVSFVITSMLKAGKGADEPLAGLVDRRRVGVAGHSLGGITTLGIAAHTCCHDERVRAAIVLAGDPLSFPKGRFDYRNAPPMLLVHGTEDSAVTYDASIDVFNRARSPKGIVTVLDGDHGSPVAPSNPAFASVVRATTDFLDGYVQGDRAARRRIAEAAEPGVTEIRFETKPGKRATIPTTPREVRDLKATVTPRRNLERRAGRHRHLERLHPGKDHQHRAVLEHGAGRRRRLRPAVGLHPPAQPDRGGLVAARHRDRRGGHGDLRRGARLRHRRERRRLARPGGQRPHHGLVRVVTERRGRRSRPPGGRRPGQRSRWSPARSRHGGGNHG